MEIALLLLVLIPAFGAVVGSIIGRDNEKDRDIFNTAITGLELVAVTMMYPIVKDGTIHMFFPSVMGTGLYLKLDMLRYIFVWFTAAVWFLTTLYSTQYLIRYENRNRYYMFYMMTLSATVGLFLSENLLNLFTFSKSCHLHPIFLSFMMRIDLHTGRGFLTSVWLLLAVL